MIKFIIRFILLGTVSIFMSFQSLAQTGDALMDTWIAPFQFKGGNNNAPTLLNPLINYGTGVTKCNSSGSMSWEDRCPSDLLYTPNANTGGYQAFGVGASNYEGGTYVYPNCYLGWYWVTDMDYGGYWELGIFCDYYVVSVVSHTYGAAAARIRFGGSSTNTPFGQKPMSTLAFKANTTYQPADTTISCAPVPTGTAAHCGPFLQDRYAVPDGGYEDKIIITDHGCTKLTRDDNSSDAQANCFTRDGNSWATNFPVPYVDTTLSDSGSSYVPGMATTHPEGFNEGITYLWWINFYQLGLEGGVGHTASHTSAVTTLVNLQSYVCGVSPQFCYFNVDQTHISPSSSIQ